MKTDIRKIIIIFVVAILFAILVFSTIEAVHPSPKYEDYCRDFQARPLTKEVKDCNNIELTSQEIDSCKGYIEYIYDSEGCAIDYKCNTCQNDYQAADDQHRQYVFYISAILALIAIGIGLYLPVKANTLNEWIGTGFMLGGAFTLFFGTAFSFSSLDRIIRPIVILLELILVIYISYKKINNLKK